MFVIRQQQLDAFRMPYREQLRQRAMASLRAEGLTVEEQPDGRSVVGRDNRGAATTLSYNDRLLPTAITKPLGEQYALAYDQNGRLTHLNYPNGEQLQLAHNADGLLTRLQTAPDQAYQLAYRKELLDQVTYPGGSTQRFGYDTRGLLTHLTDRNGHTRHYHRDPLDGMLLGQTDPMGRSTQYTFEAGQLTGVVYPDGSRQTVAWDEDDESLYVTLRDDKGFIQQYDGEQLAELNWQDGPWVRFTHDADGRPLTVRTEDSLVAYGYAAHGLSSERGVLGTTELSYDADGQLSQLQLVGGQVVGYEYDLNGRLSAIDIGGKRIEYQYGPQDLLTGITYPNGLGQQITQPHLGGLAHTRLTSSFGQPLHEQTYTYDAQQRLTGIQNKLTGQTQQLRYDAESRLLAVVEPHLTQPREQFRYDAAGGLNNLNGWPVQTGPMGEIRAVGPDQWQYDALGNATYLRGPQGAMQLDFARNSTLRRLLVNGQTWQYYYDGLGRRIGKTDGTQRWQYAWLEGRLIAETYQPTPQATPTLRQYVYHPDSYTPVAFVEAGEVVVLIADNRGAVTHAYNNRGELVWQGQYSAYGYCTERVTRIRQPLRLAGQYADAESGLHYNVGRYYAPFVGTYLSLDPQWLDALDTHPYTYARADPYGRHDPLGTIAPLLIIGGAALLGGVISAGVTAYQGGSWRQVGASFAHGALSGAGAAAGAMLGGPVGLMAGAALGGFAGTLAEQAINGDKLCLPCAVQSAVIEGLLAGVFAGLGKLLAPVLGRIGRAIAGSRIGQAVGQRLSQAGAALRSGAQRIRQRFQPRPAPPATPPPPRPRLLRLALCGLVSYQPTRTTPRRACLAST